MAHELLIDGGKTAMFYVDEVPWHGLGTPLSSPPTSAEAIRAARLDWAVAKVPLCVATDTGVHELPGRFALLRADRIGQPDCHAFGVAGGDYTPLQNADAFAFFDPLVQAGNLRYETAGALRHGQRVWILARLTAGDVEVAEGDIVQRYLLLSNSHDGHSSVQVKFTPVRVVCQNTLTLALSQGQIIRVRHDADLTKGLEDARKLLGLVEREYDDLEAMFRRLVASELKRERALQYFAEVFPTAGSADADRRALENRRWAWHFYERGRGNDLPKVKSTLWAAYNGVTELIDHCKPGGLGADCTWTRLQSVWFGNGAAVKARALRLAQRAAGIAVS